MSGQEVHGEHHGAAPPSAPAPAPAQATTPATSPEQPAADVSTAAVAESSTSAPPDAAPAPIPASPGENRDHTTPIEVDVGNGPDGNGNDDGDGDEGYETDGQSAASTSISSSVRDYVWENNRRYHKFQEGRYLIPNDNEEQEREDMKHVHVVARCGGKLHFAPLENPQRILDVGTGTGIWAIDMGDEYPDAEFIHGIDLSPIQPAWVPPNVKFIVDDAEAEWLYPPDSLDYVHFRHMSIAIKNWPRVLAQAYRALKPGGWIELQDMHFLTRSDDDTIPPDYQYDEFLRLLNAGLGKFGFDIHALTHNVEWLEQAGFTRVQDETFKVPIGTWPRDQQLKRIGLYNRTVTLGVLDGTKAPLIRGLGWSPEQVGVFLVGVRRDLMNNSIHSYFTLHMTYGQKPLGPV